MANLFSKRYAWFLRSPVSSYLIMKSEKGNVMRVRTRLWLRLARGPRVSIKPGGGSPLPQLLHLLFPLFSSQIVRVVESEEENNEPGQRASASTGQGPEGPPLCCSKFLTPLLVFRPVSSKEESFRTFSSDSRSEAFSPVPGQIPGWSLMPTVFRPRSKRTR